MFKRVHLWLAIVVAIIVALSAISIPKYRSAVRQSRETVLKDNLFEVRRVIKQYISDKHQTPHSLQDLVDAGYFRQLPIDPITNSNSSWKPVIETIAISPGRTDYGVVDLHSGSTSISSEGTAYSSW
jgi:general secretion pathway protein G